VSPDSFAASELSILPPMSGRRCAGFLEGMDRVARNVIADQGLGDPAVHHVAGAIEECVDVQLQPGVREAPPGPILIEFHQRIDIAVRAGFSPRKRAEHRGVRHAEQPQLALVSAESFEHVAESRGRLSPRVRQTDGLGAAESRHGVPEPVGREECVPNAATGFQWVMEPPAGVEPATC
jgi:hypothetical protein